MTRKTTLQIAGAIAVTLAALAAGSTEVAALACPQTTTTWLTTAQCNDSGRIATSGGAGSGSAKVLQVYCSGTGCGQQTGFAVAHGLTSGNVKKCEVSSIGATQQVACPSTAVKHRVWAVPL